MKRRVRRIIVPIKIIALLMPSFLFAQPSTKGTEFWVAFMDNVDLSSNGQPMFSFLVSAEVNTSGTISLPATGFTQNFTANAGQVTEIFLPNSVFYPVGSEFVGNQGLKVVTNDPVNISVQHHRMYFSEASIVLPVQELGDHYLAMTHTDLYGAQPAEFIIEATADNTIVDITPSTLTKGLKPAGVTFSVALNKGEVYQVQTMGDLTGTDIRSRDGKKIALFSGAKQANVFCLWADDHLYDQDYPVSSWGNEFVVLPFFNGNGDLVRVLAAEDQTQVYFGCTQPILLNRGEFFDTVLYLPKHVVSTKPVAIGQFKKGQDCSGYGDPTFIINNPFNHFSTRVRFNTLTNAITGYPFTTHAVNVAIRTSAIPSFTLDGNTVGNFYPISGFAGYSYANISLNAGTHVLQSDSGFYAFAFGYGGNDAYSYHLGYENVRASSNPGLSMQHGDTACAGIGLQFNGTGNGITSWNWSFGDEICSQNQNQLHSYSLPGNYLVTLTGIDGSGCPVVTQDWVHIENCADLDECGLFVPTAFSPNGDGQNDVLYVRSACAVKRLTFRVFDRWGAKVFESVDLNSGWDGMYKGQRMNTAVFAYTLQIEFTNGNTVSRSGNISLIN